MFDETRHNSMHGCQRDKSSLLKNSRFPSHVHNSPNSNYNHRKKGKREQSFCKIYDVNWKNRLGFFGSHTCPICDTEPGHFITMFLRYSQAILQLFGSFFRALFFFCRKWNESRITNFILRAQLKELSRCYGKSVDFKIQGTHLSTWGTFYIFWTLTGSCFFARRTPFKRTFLLKM